MRNLVTLFLCVLSANLFATNQDKVNLGFTIKSNLEHMALLQKAYYSYHKNYASLDSDIEIACGDLLLPNIDRLGFMSNSCNKWTVFRYESFDDHQHFLVSAREYSKLGDGCYREWTFGDQKTFEETLNINPDCRYLR